MATLFIALLTLRMWALVLQSKSISTLSNFWNFNVYFTYYLCINANTRHVCTYSNAFLVVIPNIVTKFQIVYNLETFVKCLTCRLLTPVAWKTFMATLFTALLRRYHDFFAEGGNKMLSRTWITMYSSRSKTAFRLENWVINNQSFYYESPLFSSTCTRM